MAPMSPFGNPLFLGFDRLEEVVDRLARSPTDSYPPYNVIHLGNDQLRITLAIAGFEKNDLSVTVERDELHVRGKQEEENDTVYLHRGIAARQFHRTFLLAEGIDIANAEMDNGLLHIDLKHPVKADFVKTVVIKTDTSEKTS